MPDLPSGELKCELLVGAQKVYSELHCGRGRQVRARCVGLGCMVGCRDMHSDSCWTREPGIGIGADAQEGTDQARHSRLLAARP